MIKKWLKSFKNKLLSSRLFMFSKNIKDNKKHIKGNLEDFSREQKRELKELLRKEESFSKFLKDSSIIFKDYFIPSDSNDNRPKILRAKQLTIIAFFLLVLKVSLALYIFTIYQEEAEMSVAMVDQILVLTNESRVANGAPVLKLDPYLSQAAQIKAEDMLINNYFSHTSPDGRKPWDFVNRSQYPYMLVGENLAMNFITSNDVHAALMASASHKKNLLNAKYSDVGIYVASGKINGQETNVLVEIFAYTKQAVEPKIVIEPEIAIKAEITPDTIESPVVAQIKQEGSNISTLGLSGSKIEEVELITDLEIIKNQNAIPLELSVETLNEETLNEEVLIEEIMSEEVLNNEQGEEIDYLYLEAGLANEPVEIDINKQNGADKAARTMSVARLIYAVFLLSLIILLLINILVRITIQHESIILQTILLLILIVVLVMFDFNFMVQLRNAAGNIILF